MNLDDEWVLRSEGGTMNSAHTLSIPNVRMKWMQLYNTVQEYADEKELVPTEERRSVKVCNPKMLELPEMRWVRQIPDFLSVRLKPLCGLPDTAPAYWRRHGLFGAWAFIHAQDGFSCGAIADVGRSFSLLTRFKGRKSRKSGTVDQEYAWMEKCQYFFAYARQHKSTISIHERLPLSKEQAVGA